MLLKCFDTVGCRDRLKFGFGFGFGMQFRPVFGFGEMDCKEFQFQTKLSGFVVE